MHSLSTCASSSPPAVAVVLGRFAALAKKESIVRFDMVAAMLGCA
jgi:hypothetical protein